MHINGKLIPEVNEGGENLAVFGYNEIGSNINTIKINPTNNQRIKINSGKDSQVIKKNSNDVVEEIEEEINNMKEY